MPLQNGKIYKITSNSTDKIYIGSTCLPLEQRLSIHKSSYKVFLNGKRRNVSSFEIVKYEDCNIILIEEIQYETNNQLLDRERFYIETNNNCVNLYIPNRTKKEYYQAYKTEIIQYNKQRYYNNREKILEYAKQRYRNLKLLNSD
jgi:hypothetical protein